MKLDNQLKNERTGVSVLYNFTKGYNKTVPMSLYDIVLPFLYNDTFREEILLHDTLEATIRSAYQKDSRLKDKIITRIKRYQDITKRALGIALLNQSIQFDVNMENVIGTLKDADILELEECIQFGIWMRDYDEETVFELFDKQPLKITFLQTDTLGNDIDLSKFDDLGDITYYPTCTDEELLERCSDTTVLITNKNNITKEVIDACHNLQLICLTATGTNNVDIEYARSKDIKVCNVSGYSTSTVTQLTLLMALSLQERLLDYDDFVKNGDYDQSGQFSYFDYSFHDMSSLTWGIVGLGEIGRSVALLATNLGCKVQYYSTSGITRQEDYKRVDLDTLLSTSDIISIHAPLNEQTYHLFHKETFTKMKNTSILINVGRGPIINEVDLVEALNNNTIGYAGLDVFEQEPLPINSPIYQIKDKNKILLTPHIGWGSIEARSRLVEEVYLNIKSFIEGKDRNIC